MASRGQNKQINLDGGSKPTRFKVKTKWIIHLYLSSFNLKYKYIFEIFITIEKWLSLGTNDNNNKNCNIKL